MTLHEAGKLTEEQARAYLDGIRWPEGPACPHCGATEIQRALHGKAHRAGLYRCGACRKQYTVTVATIMHRSHIPLNKWVLAFHLICSAKKGISALQLHRNLGFGSYRTAWHLCHRIRLAMREEPLSSMLMGSVEADETFVGGRPRFKTPHPARERGRRATQYRPGPGADFKDRKTPVLALVERGGRVRSRVLPSVSGKNLREAIAEQVHPLARLYTDERPAYKTIGRRFRSHELVNHSAGEYVRGLAHINTAESYFALLKRGVMGAFRHVSRDHLHRYLGEFQMRWNTRQISDGERAVLAIRGGDGKRLVYRDCQLTKRRPNV